MEILRALWWADSKSLTRWFSTKHLSRLIVAALFFLLFAAITAFIWGISSAFFHQIAQYEQFGQITANYIIHASIVIILLLSLGSSIVSYIGLLLSSSPSLSYLLSLPVSPKVLNVWLFTKAVTANFALMAFAFVPIAIAYSNAFGTWNIFFLIRILLVLLCIVLISSSVAMVIGLVCLTYLRTKEYPASIAGFVIFILTMTGIFRLIFPPQLSSIYDAAPETYLALFSSLPLNNPILPTAWMTDMVTSGFSFSSFLILIMTAVIVIICLKIQQTRLVPTLLGIHSATRTKNISRSGYETLSTTNMPLVLKDWLSIIRLPSETGYGLFLGSLAIFFFVFLSFSVRHDFHQQKWNTQLTVFAFVWIVFFATAFFLRFLFPLVAREGKNAWYLFTLPISRKRILLAKIILSIFFSIPVMIFSGVVWYLLPFVKDNQGELTYISIVVIFTLAISQVLLGAILPNFSQGNDPEKMSTSGMGLTTLFTCGLTAVLGGSWIGHMMTGNNGKIFFSFIPFCSGILFLLILWFTTQKFLKKWEW